ncbi:transposase [Enterococcus faecium]|uniref:IS200/IS605 family element RNA-guided endonuclease TnpB n=1 Tax=Enterococcus faecium TaxID=1352 RepID=UPI000CF08103|nr:IS200/IS605 family element RNA-guided endonuclease TnpB [Enterococcus faecium]EGP4826847.1 IS200/IS605 family element transposase accessory protein TnpB [Enterococcus faecium]EGP5042761.1 IS200/IS605 family element transposase accessory protein TnpB [Enterococcus faecium]EGP5143407.1 transposase [Enterococcus faecium]EGP5172014.1 transposase [Enterococcus faecium]EGP5181873.1 transposase [Enterococcus faecium]
MLQHKAYKFRIYPNQEQEILIAKTIGCSRFIYNHFLNLWNHEYTTTGKGLSYHSCSAMLPQMKRNPETIWLKEIDSIAIQSSLKNLSDSFSRFFRKQNRRPQFKSKKNPIQSYTTKNVNNSIQIRNNFVKLPKLGLVKFAKSQEPKGRILNATIRKNSSGKFFVSILCEEEIMEYPKTTSAIGIDLGITDFAILSDGQKIDNNKFTAKMQKKLKREQRKLSRRALLAKQKGINLFEAKNYQKQKRKVARLHEKVMNQRTDFLNKLSTEMIKNHDIICMEDLNTKSMLRNHKLAKSISDVSWSSFVTKLQYKADWHGRKIIKIDKWFPSSQICSECGHRDGKKSLKIREWTCPICHTHHDRDINASINILTEGLRIQALA